MFARAKAIRLSILISTVVIGLIIVIQAIWLTKVYQYEQKEFDQKVVGAIKGVYEDIDLVIDPTRYLNDIVTKPDPHIYIASVERWEPSDTIAFYLHHELEDFNIFADCRLTLFDSKKGVFFEKDIYSATSKNKSLNALPASATKLSHNSIILYFPHRERYIISNMIFWIVTSLILLGVLVWLGLSLFYLNRQKSLNELQKDLVNNFSHEFKTPLSVISLAAESMKKNSTVEKKEKILRYANMVESQSLYLQGQIDRLLRYSFSEKAGLQLIREQVNIHDLVREATINLQPLIEQKKAEIKFELNAENPVIYADKNYILIVLINLVENALKYSKEPKIIIGTANKEHNLEINVKDNGQGIEKKFLSDIFKKFFRVSKGDIRTSKGFGIGLSFVKKIIDSHHGTINVESIPQIGSNFIISLHQNQF
jgi:two-component system phosphate regulon sensor histidine kinase PhoR